MKQCLLLFLLFASPEVFFGQMPFRPFVEKSAWKEILGYWGDVVEIRFSIEGDTAFHGLPFAKIVWLEDDFGKRPIGALWQDSISLKVWYRLLENFPAPTLVNFNIGDDVLLYDFNVQPGDILDWKPEFQTVSAVDSIKMLDGTWRRRIYFQSPTSFHAPSFWVEGMGGNFGLFTSYVFRGNNLDEYYYLGCFSENGTLLYSQPGYGACQPFNVVGGYPPFPTVSGIWSEVHWSWCSYSGVQYVLSGDTTLSNGETAQKLYFRRTYSEQKPCPTPSTMMLDEPLTLIGLLRQDTLARKIWFTKLASNQAALSGQTFANLPVGTEKLLYDFDLKPNQKLDWKSWPNEVSEVRQIHLNDGSPRLAWYFKGQNGLSIEGDFWVEGIGGNRGVLSPYVPYDVFHDNGEYLKCFREETLYQIAEVPVEFCDSIILLSSPEIDFSASVKVFPNPFSESFTLDLPDFVLPAEVLVWDVFGREVLRFGQGEVSQRVDFQSLEPGLVFLQIRGKDGQRAVGKVLKLGR